MCYTSIARATGCTHQSVAPLTTTVEPGSTCRPHRDVHPIFVPTDSKASRDRLRKQCTHPQTASAAYLSEFPTVYDFPGVGIPGIAGSSEESKQSHLYTTTPACEHRRMLECVLMVPATRRARYRYSSYIPENTTSYYDGGFVSSAL